jgi:hypothetical protein
VRWKRTLFCLETKDHRLNRQPPCGPFAVQVLSGGFIDD